MTCKYKEVENLFACIWCVCWECGERGRGASDFHENNKQLRDELCFPGGCKDYIPNILELIFI